MKEPKEDLPVILKQSYSETIYEIILNSLDNILTTYVFFLGCQVECFLNTRLLLGYNRFLSILHLFLTLSVTFLVAVAKNFIRNKLRTDEVAHQVKDLAQKRGYMEALGFLPSQAVFLIFPVAITIWVFAPEA